MREIYYHHIHVLRKIISLILVIGLAWIYQVTNRREFLVINLVFLTGFLILDIVHHYLKTKNKIIDFLYKIYPKKRIEYGQFLSDATIFFISTLVMIFVFPKEIVVPALILFIFIDSSEQIFGNLFPSRGYLWNKDKGWKGTLLGCLSGLMVVFLLSKLWDFPLGIAVIPAAMLGAIGGIAKKYDNILIPWVAAVVLYL